MTSIQRGETDSRSTPDWVRQDTCVWLTEIVSCGVGYTGSNIAMSVHHEGCPGTTKAGYAMVINADVPVGTVLLCTGGIW